MLGAQVSTHTRILYCCRVQCNQVIRTCLYECNTRFIHVHVNSVLFLTHYAVFGTQYSAVARGSRTHTHASVHTFSSTASSKIPTDHVLTMDRWRRGGASHQTGLRVYFDQVVSVRRRNETTETRLSSWRVGDVQSSKAVSLSTHIVSTKGIGIIVFRLTDSNALSRAFRNFLFYLNIWIPWIRTFIWGAWLDGVRASGTTILSRFRAEYQVFDYCCHQLIMTLLLV